MCASVTKFTATILHCSNVIFIVYHGMILFVEKVVNQILTVLLLFRVYLNLICWFTKYSLKIMLLNYRRDFRPAINANGPISNMLSLCIIFLRSVMVSEKDSFDETCISPEMARDSH